MKHHHRMVLTDHGSGLVARRERVADIAAAETDVVAPAPRRTPGNRLRAALAVHPRGVWAMALCNLLLWTGRGMVVPFTVIYFSQIVGITPSLVGTGIAVSGFAGIGFVLLAAGQIDRRGGRPVLLACLSIISLAMLLHPLATSAWPFFAVTLFLNLASQLYWPSSDATIASVAPRERVAEAMSVLRVANAVGIGAGGFIGGMIVAGGGLAEYRLLYVVSAATILSATLLVWRIVPAVVLPSRGEDGNHGTWGDVFPDRLFLYASAVLFILIFGFTQLQMSVPAYLREEAGIGEGTIGALFTLNTIIVVLTQIPIAARVNRGNVSLLLAIGALFWVVAFVCMIGTRSLGAPAAVGTFFAFTLGELLFMPLSAVIPVRLAPVHLRGRYFAALSIMWGASYAIASFAAGLALDLPDPGILWPIMAGLMLVGAFAALPLRGSARLIPDSPT